ncbi:MAG: glycosyltransferase [Holdemanella sp.]|nr:glycosyltransferase [Holdemanella sp.]
MPTISVAMCTYKEDVSIIKESIESILNQTYKDIEYVIVLDNEKNEDHKRVIREYQKKDPRIVFDINPNAHGRASAINYAISLCTCDYIAIMDADDIALPNRLEIEMDYLLKNNLDFIGGNIRVIDDDGKMMYKVGKIPDTHEKISRLSRYSNCMVHPTYLVKKEVYDKNNGYRIIDTIEDLDFQHRAIMNGFKLGNVNEEVLCYRMSKKSVSRGNLFKQYLYLKYLTACYAKGQIADIEKCKEFVTKNDTPAKSKKYTDANKYFNQMLEAKENKHYGTFLSNGFKVVFTSKEYLDKIYRLFMLKINA